jgi:hypothetical protein
MTEHGLRENSNNIATHKPRLYNNTFALPAFSCRPLGPAVGSKRGASFRANLSAVADLAKRTNQERKQLLDVVSSPGACFQKVAPPLLG